MKFDQLVIEDRRYLILRALQSAAGYQASVNLLQAFLDSFGQKVSSDLVVGDLTWLAEQGLIELDKSNISAIAKLLNRGEDIALGRSTYPGVRRPTTGELNG